MENPQPNSKKIILNYGLMLGLISVLLGVVMYVTNAYLNPSFVYSLIGFAILVVFITLGINAYKKENANYLSIKEALKIGVGISLIGGLISMIWMLLLMFVIEPEFMSQLADVQREQIDSQYPNMTDEQKQNALEMSAKFSSPWIMAAFSLIGNLFFGLLISLVVGLIKKNKNPYEA